MLDKNYAMLKDIKLNVSIEFGSTKKSIEELADIDIGSTIVLDQLAGEWQRLFINGKCVGTCEPVVINERFGVRITALHTP